MSKLSLREIAQSQLDSTPVIDGQLIVCLDTGNAYRDTATAHVKIGSDLEVVSDLPLAPLAEKLYYLKPNKLYSYLGGNWVLLNDDFSIKTNKSALNGDAKIILDGSKKTSVALKGSGVATVVTDSDGQLVVNSPDPNTILEHITNKEIDTMMGKIVVPDEDKSVTIDPSLSNPGQVADAKATGDAIREEVERAKKVENEIKSDVNNRFASQNVLIGTETGNPIAVDDAFPAPLCGLTVYGKSTQDGTPTPDAPVPIVSAGDGGSVAVTLSDGKNKTQTLTLPTPTGLPGIPVTSGGNYTDQSGQQWVCDEVDLERGVKVQRVNAYKFYSSYGFRMERTSLSLTRFNIAIGNVLTADTGTLTSSALCSALPLGPQGSTYSRTNVFTITNMLFYINIGNIASLAELQQYLQQTPMSLTAILATPIETPLTPAEIAAYKALTAYGPDTVVQAGDGAGVKLGYQRDVNIAIKKLEDAVASMTNT